MFCGNGYKNWEISNHLSVITICWAKLCVWRRPQTNNVSMQLVALCKKTGVCFIDVEYIYGFVWWGGLQAKSMTSQRNRAVTIWRVCVTMATLWQQKDGGYILLWKRYVNNKMAAMRFLHLQQYSHRLNLLYVFFDAIQTISCSDGWPWTKPGNMVMTRRQGNNQWNGGISAHPSPYNSECKNLLENMSPRHFGIKKAASSLLIFQKGQSINAKYYTSLLVQFKNILKGKTRKISSSGLVLAR